MKYFNVIVAIQVDSCWKLQYRIFTSANKVYCTKFTKVHTLGIGKLPPEFMMNTALVICIKSEKVDIDVSLLGI